MTTYVRPNVALQTGERITAYTSTFPARRYWYRHDKAVMDGKELEGFVQVQLRSGRIEITTCFRDSCVRGQDVDWLIRMNQEHAI